MALRILMGMPTQPKNPNVQIMVNADVVRGTRAERPLRIKKRIDRTSIRADKGPNNVKSSYKLDFSSAFILGGPT